MQCRFHEGHQLQNFCSNQDCSLPLCPKCIHPHLSTLGSHHIASLPGFISGTAECLRVCISGLEQELASLDNELSPSKLRHSYMEMIQKSRAQNIQQISRYYNKLEQQLVRQIEELHSHHLQSLRKPVQEKLGILNHYLRNLSNEQTVISAAIKINSEDLISTVQELFSTFKDKKNALKISLPIIDFGPNGRAQIKTHLKQQLPLRGFSRVHGTHSNRIGELQHQLTSIRTRWI